MFARQTSALGLPINFYSRDAAFLNAALIAYPQESDVAEGPAHRVRLEPEDADDVTTDPEIVVIGKKIFVRGRGINGEADASVREGWCRMPPEFVSDPVRFAEALDPVVLFLLTRSGRIPIHASVVMLEGTAVMFAGRSGSGKSTLALAAQEAGFAVLTDDTAYLQTAPHFRIWGLPRPIHVFSKDAPASDLPLRWRSGRWKKAMSPLRRYASADHAVVCLLERGRHVAMTPIAPEAALDRLQRDLEPGFDHFREELPQAMRIPTTPSAWRLQLSADPAEAIACVRQTLTETVLCTPST